MMRQFASKWLRALVYRVKSLSSFVARTSIPSRQRGDTIIEVLLAMTVVGLVLGGAFRLANDASRTGQAAQERTEALKIAESQLELTKVYYRTDRPTYDGLSASNPGDHFCITENPAASSERAATTLADVCSDTDGLLGPGLYSIDITPNVDGNVGTYEIAVTWEQINSSTGQQGNVVLYYKMGTL